MNPHLPDVGVTGSVEDSRHCESSAGYAAVARHVERLKTSRRSLDSESSLATGSWDDHDYESAVRTGTEDYPQPRLELTPLKPDRNHDSSEALRLARLLVVLVRCPKKKKKSAPEGRSRPSRAGAAALFTRTEYAVVRGTTQRIPIHFPLFFFSIHPCTAVIRTHKPIP